MALQKLHPKATKTITKAGRHSDGGGLYLNVKKSGTKSWVFIYKRNHKKTEIGLGGIAGVSLAKAREIAQTCREAVAEGLDPRDVLRPTAGKTFLDAAQSTMDNQGIYDLNPKSVYQWERSLFVLMKGLHKKPVASITRADVLECLEPVWNATPETGRRTRARIETVFDRAITMGWREADNPARWKGGLKGSLTKNKKRVKHFAALPYADLPAFMQDLKGRPALSARLMEFTILTAARTTEARMASWDEIDFDKKLWTVPASRMKKGREHIVPLSSAAMDIISDLYSKRLNNWVFIGSPPSQPLSNGAMLSLKRRMGRPDITPHGFRSTFRDWAGDETGFSREVIEFSLSHVVGDEAERAYRRGSALEKRTRLMQAWADYATDQQTGNVVKLAKR